MLCISSLGRANLQKPQREISSKEDTKGRVDGLNRYSILILAISAREQFAGAKTLLNVARRKLSSGHAYTHDRMRRCIVMCVYVPIACMYGVTVS